MLALLAAPWARAQKPMTVGVLSPGTARFPPIEAFDKTLEEKGWVLGKTVAVEYRFSKGRAELDAKNAAEFVAQPVDLIVAWGPGPMQAVKNLVHRIPVVFLAVNGPVERGLVQSLAHPGGNVTGITFEAGHGTFPKQLQLLHECLPGLKRVGVLVVAWEPVRPSVREGLAYAAQTLGLELSDIALAVPEDLRPALAKAKQRGMQALFVLPTSFASAYRKPIADAALALQVPSIHGMAEAATVGALMSYSPNLSEIGRRGALYVDRILKGAKPGDLPVEEPSHFEFAINMKTANALGLSIPRSLLLRADRVIE